MKSNIEDIGSQAVCITWITCEKSALASGKFAVKTIFAVSSTEFCQSTFDQDDNWKYKIGIFAARYAAI